MVFDKRNIRQLHRKLVPIMVAPILITALTGSLFQIASLMSKEEDFYWLLDFHKGHFGIINLETIYPFLNAFGLLLLMVSGVFMWWTGRPRKRQNT